MKNLIKNSFPTNLSKIISKHLENIPSEWLKIELENFNLFHPTGEENFWSLLENGKHISSKSIKKDIEENNLTNFGGVYCLYTKFGWYIGETLNFENRFNQHIEDLKNKVHHSAKLLNYYNSLKNKELSFIILEYGNPTEFNKAEFKLYCLKRERYYIELFQANTKKVINEEDTLKIFYIEFGKKFKLGKILEEKDFLERQHYMKIFSMNNKAHRPNSMEDLNFLKRINPSTSIEEEQKKYKIIIDILKNRKQLIEKSPTN